MKKSRLVNLIKHYVDKNELGFEQEARRIAVEFDNSGDYELAEYILALLSPVNTFEAGGGLVKPDNTPTTPVENDLLTDEAITLSSLQDKKEAIAKIIRGVWWKGYSYKRGECIDLTEYPDGITQQIIDLLKGENKEKTMRKRDKFLKWFMIGNAIVATVCFIDRGEWSGAILSIVCGLWAFLYFEYYEMYHTLLKRTSHSSKR